MNAKKFFSTVLPVMFGFIIMSFVDLAGIAANYAKESFEVSDTVSKLLAVACFIWFLLLSVPTGIAMNKWGRKPLVIVSFIVTMAGMLVPVAFMDSFAAILVAFCLLGVGNTILQVALNPLVQDVVGKDGLTGTLTIGQALKATMSLITPILLPIFASAFGHWQLAFLIFAAISLVALVWLAFAPVEKKIDPNANLSVLGTVALLKDRTILLFFIAILILVGVDVGTSATLPRLLQEKAGLSLDQGTALTSFYFAAKALAAFAGGVLLMKTSERSFYAISSVLALAGLLLMLLGSGKGLIIGGVIVFGAGYANLFSIIFGLALKHAPDRSNEVSALLITGVAGGAIVTPLLGVVYESFGTYNASVVLLAAIFIYVLALIGLVNRTSRE
ncbi:MAG: MFS transporter [Bacteroidales bacterium]|nr:MFS transporter [Bacteroidales bacterium]